MNLNDAKIHKPKTFSLNGSGHSEISDLNVSDLYGWRGRDVTDNLYKQLVEKSPDIIFALSYPDLKFTFLNRAFEKITGMKTAAWLGKSIVDIVYPEDVSLAHEKLKENLNSKKPKNFWLRVRSHKKNFLVLEFQLVPKSTSAKTEGGVGVARDITRRKEWENNLKFQRSLLRAQSEASIDGIFVVSRDKEAILYNNHFVEMWQVNGRVLKTHSEDLIMKHLSGKLKKPREFLRTISESYKNTSKKSHDELELNDGRIFSRYSAPLAGGDGSNYGRIWFFRDITEQKGDERKKDDFVAIASHELKTPITSLKAFTQVLTKRQEKSGDKSMEFFLGRMTTQINNLTELVTDLLDVTRLRTGKMDLNCEYFNLGDFLNQSVELSINPDTKQRIKFDVESNPRVRADKHRLRQVLMNLLSNAFKYSKANPKVIVRVGATSKEAVVSVKDFGTGIEAGKLKKIFEPFSQFRKVDADNMPSLGLGLYISSEIIKRHNGRIWAKSQPHRGSTFYFSLPKSNISNN